VGKLIQMLDASTEQLLEQRANLLASLKRDESQLTTLRAELKSQGINKEKLDEIKRQLTEERAKLEQKIREIENQAEATMEVGI